jgi:purine-binding chemotaxis protein CheW
LGRELNKRRRSDEDPVSESLATAHQESVWPDLTDDPTQYLTFLLAGELFAIRAPVVREIISYREVVAASGMPACVRGVVDFERAAIPVVDPLSLFGRLPSPVTKRTSVLIIDVSTDGQQQPIGVVIDALSDVVEISATDLQHVPLAQGTCHADFVLGRGKVRGRLLNLLAIDKVLEVPATDALAKTLREAALRGSARKADVARASGRT